MKRRIPQGWRRFSGAVVALWLSAVPSVAQEPVFFDDFEYVAERNAPGLREVFTSHGWGGFKDMTISNPGAGGYIYTTDSIAGFPGSFPGRSSSRVLCLESRAGTEAPEVIDGYMRQTDFYLQYGRESGEIGDVPADIWFQYWTYTNDTGAERSRLDRTDKWIYPTRTSYPATAGTYTWLVGVGTSSRETDGSPMVELGDVADYFFQNRPPGAVFTRATEVPTNQDKLGQNLATDPMEPNTWHLVKIHLDTSGEQGTYEVWAREYGEDWVKLVEWIGGETDDFTWPIPASLRDGHKMFRMPTTLSYTIPPDSGGDAWIYLDDFCIATSEDALPVYTDNSSPPGGLQRPGDANQDSALDLSDPVWMLGHLFLGSEPTLPCGGGTAAGPGPGDLALLDVNGDRRIDLSDAVSCLGFLFLGGPPPALGTECVRITGCQETCR